MTKKTIALTLIFTLIMSSITTVFAQYGNVRCDGNYGEWRNAPVLFSTREAPRNWHHVEEVKYIPQLHRDKVFVSYKIKYSAMFYTYRLGWSTHSVRRNVYFTSRIRGEDNRDYTLKIYYQTNGRVKFWVNLGNQNIAWGRYSQNRNTRYVEFFLPVKRMNSGDRNGYYLKLYPESTDGRFGIMSTGSSGPIVSTLIAIGFVTYWYFKKKKKQLNTMEV